MSMYSIDLLRAAQRGTARSGRSIVIQFFHDGARRTGTILNLGSRISVQILGTGELIEDIEAHQVMHADVARV